MKKSFYYIFILAIYINSQSILANNQNVLSFSEYNLDSTETRGPYSLFHNPANLIYSYFMLGQLHIGKKSIHYKNEDQSKNADVYELFLGKSTQTSKKISFGMNFSPKISINKGQTPLTGFKTSAGLAFKINPKTNLGISIVYETIRNQENLKDNLLHPAIGFRWNKSKSTTYAGVIKTQILLKDSKYYGLRHTLGFGYEKKWNHISITTNSSLNLHKGKNINTITKTLRNYTLQNNNSIKVWPSKNHMISLSLGFSSKEIVNTEPYTNYNRIEPAISYRIQDNKKDRYLELSYSHMRNLKHLTNHDQKKLSAHAFSTSFNYTL